MLRTFKESRDEAISFAETIFANGKSNLGAEKQLREELRESPNMHQYMVNWEGDSFTVWANSDANAVRYLRTFYPLSHGTPTIKKVVTTIEPLSGFAWEEYKP